MSLTVKVARSRNPSRAMPGVGDPGLFGTIGSLVSKVASVASVIPGPIGWAGSAVSRLTARQPQPVSVAGVMRQPTPFAPMQMPQQPTAGIRGAVERFLPGGETGMETVPTVGAPAGYHVNKTEYWVKDKDGNWTFVPKESRWVKNRRRNPLNPRAASKAIGRLESLKRATARFSRITIRKKCCKK